MRCCLWLLLFPTLVVAAAADHADLPPVTQIEQALSAHPSVRAADAGVRVEVANRDKLSAGPYEFALKVSGTRRRERPLDVNYREHELALERAIRLPGKAAKDAALGEAGIEQSRYALGEALHESGRLLLGGWFAWQREAAAVREWAAQVEILQRQHEVVGKRVAVGDAAKLEQLLSGAQLAQAEAQLAQARDRCERAAQALTQQFPAITLPTEVTVQAPLAIAEPLEYWRERILAHNHELAVARIAAQRGHLGAQRLDAERLPDPTLGIRLGSERDGQERIVGLQLTIPLPGAGRAAGARAGQAEAEAAAAREALVRVKVETETLHTVSLAHGAHGHWLRLADVAHRMEENASLLDRAWRLGEGQFAELQTARRQAIEARLAASQARLEANEARYRLQFDAHELWPLDIDR